MDGGVRRGTDIFKAIALGAKMVFVGRPIIWGLASGGEKGATKVLQILRDELDLTMALAGGLSSEFWDDFIILFKFKMALSITCHT